MILYFAGAKLRKKNELHCPIYNKICSFAFYCSRCQLSLMHMISVKKLFFDSLLISYTLFFTIYILIIFIKYWFISIYLIITF